jgi:hypothetical protein
MHHVTYLHLPNKKGDIFTPTKAAKIPMLLDPRTTNSVITKKAVRIPMLEHRSTHNIFPIGSELIGDTVLVVPSLQNGYANNQVMHFCLFLNQVLTVLCFSRVANSCNHCFLLYAD